MTSRHTCSQEAITYVFPKKKKINKSVFQFQCGTCYVSRLKRHNPLQSFKRVKKIITKSATIIKQYLI